MKYFIVLYVVPAVIMLYYEIRELMWAKKHHMPVSANILAMAFRILVPVFNLFLALFIVCYDIKLFLEKRKKSWTRN